ncbi:MAG TPA: putative hydro-lyase [Chloroflexota bacterium]|nr:putative hydro-lyase [Chloroflexota bacterium]
MAERPHDIRARIRTGEWTRPTGGLAPGYVQTNMVILPKEQAFDFTVFCQRNPKPCPLLEVTDPGDPEPKMLAPRADLRTDVPRYRVWRNGDLADEVTDISDLWREDLVAFLLGCSFTFDTALVNAGVDVPHMRNGHGENVPMYVTNLDTTPAGQFHGPLVVSMRAVPREKVVKAIQVTSRFPTMHGTPVHIGDAAAIGIKDVHKPDYGTAVEVGPEDVTMFWACGVTPQQVCLASKPPFMISHAPGHMFITDIRDEDMAVI